jgi:CDP-glycerol glycerophosphotransferase
MRLWRRPDPLLSVVVPVYQVAAWLPACMDSLAAATHERLEIIVVDDGSPDDSGVIADAYALRDPRVHVVHTANRGLGAARNEGLRHATGEFVAFCDSDDLVPATAYAAMLASLQRSGSDFVTGSIQRLESDGLHEPPWMRRLHAGAQSRLTVDDHPEILGDVFAWNKVFRRSFWDRAGLAWPEGVRYEDQPALTRAYLAGQFDVLSDVVYHWRIRHDGSSITQQRSSMTDLADRLVTKQMSWECVRAHGSPEVREVFLDRVLAGDLHRYFVELPGCCDAWWELLHGMVVEFWGERSLAHSGLPPLHRLTGWLVEQDRRDDAVSVMSYAASCGPGPIAHDGGRLELPPDVLDLTTVDAAALTLRPQEITNAR